MAFAYWLILRTIAMRFQFDPYNEGEVMAMVRKISQYAKAMQPAQLQARS